MRFDDLFAELDSEADQLHREQRDLQIAERTRVQLGEASWLDRCTQCDVTMRVLGLGAVRGTVARVGRTWLLLRGEAEWDWVVAVAAVTGLRRNSAPGAAERGQVTRRLTWVNAWSVLARDRATVHVACIDESRLDGVACQVGHDFVELTTES